MEEYRRAAVQRAAEAPWLEGRHGSAANSLMSGAPSTPTFTGQMSEMVQVPSDVRGENGETIMIWVPRVDTMRTKTIRKLRKLRKVMKITTTKAQRSG